MSNPPGNLDDTADGSGQVEQEPDASSAVGDTTDASAPAPDQPTVVAQSSAESELQQIAEPENLTDAQPSAGVSDSLVAPPPATAELPAALKELKAYCDSHGIKNTIEADPEYIVLELRNGRDMRRVAIFSEEDAATLLKYPLEQIVFLGDYSAVCSYRGGWIEASVRPYGLNPLGPFAQRSLFGTARGRGEKPRETEIREVADGTGLTLRLTENRGIIAALEAATPFYLRIEGVGITEHDKALNLLEDLSNSLFMQVDFRFDLPLSLVRARFPHRRRVPRGRVDQDNQLTYPRHLYEKIPSSLYWYARSAISMPLLQFLALYQCIEFFFPQFSRLETIQKIKNLLKDPSFNWSNDSDVNTILNATLEGRRGSLLDERKQLRATLQQCVDSAALRIFLNATDERKRYYGSDYKRISEKRISLSDEGSVIEQTAERMYDIRCKVVHTKNLEGTETDEIIVPFSKEADLMTDDVELIKFLARKVLIASSIQVKS